MIKLRSAGAALIVALFVALALFTTGAFAQSARISKTSKSVTAHTAVIVHTHAVRPFGAFRTGSFRGIGFRRFGGFRVRSFRGIGFRRFGGFRVRSFRGIGFRRFGGFRTRSFRRVGFRRFGGFNRSFGGFSGCDFDWWDCCDPCGWGAFGW
jgi:hypothetical protein